VPRKISIFLKTQDFKIVSAGATLPSPSNSPEISLEVARALFDKIHTKSALYRTAGVTLENLTLNFVSQKDLFGGNVKGDKFDLIHKQIDSLENKFGKRVVHLASTQKALNQQTHVLGADRKSSGTDSEDLDRNLLFL
jgi:hypothetical protein